MAREESVYLPISVEYLFTHLFGKLQYHGYVGETRLSVWRKDLLKAVKYLRRSIELNVSTDARHMRALLGHCDSLTSDLKSASSANFLNVAVVEHLIRLSFELLGRMPNHWERKSPYSDRFWQLDGHRSVQFHQSAEQKAAMLINMVDIDKRLEIGPHEFRNLHDAFYRGSKGDPATFLQWFKSKFPAAYCEAF